MNKKCGKCTKTVYPTEELKCLDKVWHKACFKCEVCNMTLTMKNYKGYDKKPYCNAHYPTTKHTQVADTPEARRLAENTKIQSNIKYHEQFEDMKGKKISVADDPETMRNKKNMEVVSQVAYHKTLEQKLAMEQNRPMEAVDPTAQNNRRQIGSIADYDPMQAHSPAHHQPPPTSYQPPPAAYQPPPHQQPMFTPTPYSAPAPPQQKQNRDRGKMATALYDYTAADDDEVSFMENDMIYLCEPVDEGWMFGTVERTGLRGMLPSNYVKHLNF